jgi:predicted hydrolase (HD superfamily)
MGQVEWARDLARSLLEDSLPQRWAHTRGVAARAEGVSLSLGNDANLLTAAAWLHDIGYSPDLAKTGFHPLDGARYLRDAHHAEPRLCNLVAHHSCAMIEAEERGLGSLLLAEFPVTQDRLTDALIYGDMTTGPDGHPVSVDERISEIQARYGRGHPVSRAIQRASLVLRAAVRGIETAPIRTEVD